MGLTVYAPTRRGGDITLTGCDNRVQQVQLFHSLEKNPAVYALLIFMRTNIGN